MNKETKITYVNNISVEDYNALRKSVNWINVTEKRAAIALKNSFYLCVAVCDNKPVGMARIVSDGGLYIFHNRCNRTPGLSGTSHRYGTYTP